MKIQNIISNRHLTKAVYWQIVYEWEDIIAKKMSLKVRSNLLWLVNKRYLRDVWRRVLHLNDQHVPIPSGNSIAFVMSPNFNDGNICGRKNVVPIIIDFWLSKEEEFRRFESRYKGNPAVLITSKEAYEIIREKCPSLRVFHWAISLPDDWLVDDGVPMKKWDCAVVGRPNSVLNEWMQRYAAKHENFTYIYNQRRPDAPCNNYVTSQGTMLGDVFCNRNKYRQFLKSVRVGLYSTPSKDDSRQQFKGLSAHGYNQVTPRFLEYMAAGCHVLCRYDKNPDTEYYQMDSISPNIETYDDFERRMDFALTHDVDHKRYTDYLSKHTTTSRVEKLREILNQI